MNRLRSSSISPRTWFREAADSGKLLSASGILSFSITVLVGEKTGRCSGNFLRTAGFSSAYSLRSKALFTIALVEHIRYIPYLLQGRARPGAQIIPGFV